MRWTWRTSCRCHQVRGGDGAAVGGRCHQEATRAVVSDVGRPSWAVMSLASWRVAQGPAWTRASARAPPAGRMGGIAMSRRRHDLCPEIWTFWEFS